MFIFVVVVCLVGKLLTIPPPPLSSSSTSSSSSLSPACGYYNSPPPPFPFSFSFDIKESLFSFPSSLLLVAVVLTTFVLLLFTNSTKREEEVMSFCKKGLHSFLSFTSLSDTTTTHSPSPPTPTPPPPPPPLLHKCQPGSLAIGLASATGDAHRPPNVLESATVGPPPPPVPQPTTPFHSVFADGGGLRKDTDGFLTVGFFEEVGEVVDGLMSCTESLGFESSDERRVDEGVHDLGRDGVGGGGGGDLDVRPCVLSRAKRRGESERMRDRKFPPPITSLNDKGRPSFFLRALRRDGRLELVEVRIDRPEILRASREDGRLRLEFVKEAEGLKEEADTIGITEEEEYEEEEEETATTTTTSTSTSEEEGRSKEWKVTVSSGEGFGRCHGEGRHHQNGLHVWRQHCVTIR